MSHGRPLPYVSRNRVRVGRKVYEYYYFRKDGLRINLRGEPGSAEFRRHYDELMREPEERPTFKYGSIGWLIAEYRELPKYQKRAESTKANMEYYFDILRTKHGHKGAAELSPQAALRLRNEYRKTPGKADNLMSTLSTLMGHAKFLQLRSTNPCTGIERLSNGEHEPWPGHVIEIALQRAKPKLFTAIVLHLYTGQRISDVVKMKWDDIDDDYLYVFQKKTKDEVWVYMHTYLREHLATLDRIGPYILMTRQGGGYTEDGLRGLLRELMQELVEEGQSDQMYRFHGLRKNAVNKLAEAGCTAHEIQSITKHSLAMIEHYSKKANLRKLSKSAITKWEKDIK